MAHISTYVNEKILSIDTNSTVSTGWYDVTRCDHLIFYVEGKTGDHSTHKIGVELSPDGVFNGGFYNESGAIETLVGEGYLEIHNVEAMKYVRLTVNTVEGSVSTCDVYLQGFRHE